MRALLQRVTEASVLINGEEVAHTQAGLLIFLGVAAGDTEDDARYLVDKIVNLRIFADGQNRFNHSALDVRADFLIVSQFTLLADTRKGRRPSFVKAAPPEAAEPMVQGFVDMIRDTGLKVETGRFQAHMEVEIHNDGPVTIWLDSADRYRPRKS